MSEADTQTEPVPSGAPPDAVPVAIDVACPGCEYNLRGLLGPVVDCPECGLRSDVPELAARRWDKPWYKAPGFNTLAWPAVCVYLWYFFLMPMSYAYFGSRAGVAAVVLTGLTIWGLLMYRAYKVFDAAKGLLLALAMHVLVAGFLFGIIGLFVTVILCVVGVIDGRAGEIKSVLIAALTLGCFVVVLWVSRRVERAIAGACIRHHLRRAPKP